MKQIINIALIWAILSVGACAQAQKSPKVTAEGKNSKVTYGQPSKKGRVIFGELVPMGSVWRTGANEATEITFAKDALVNGKEIKAGTYTLFTIPAKDKWTLILNSSLGQWGAYDYEKIKDKDVLQTEIPVKTVSEVEKLTYAFKDNDKGTDLSISWDTVEVVIPIVF